MRREFSAGGIVFKKIGKEIFWLIRLPKASPDYHAKIGWNFPKGWIEEGESVEEAALREVREESGIEAKILQKLPTIKFFYTDKSDGQKVMKFVTYFLMEYIRDLPEGHDFETEEVRWETFDEARKMLINSSDKKLLTDAKESLEGLKIIF